MARTKINNGVMAAGEDRKKPCLLPTVTVRGRIIWFSCSYQQTGQTKHDVALVQQGKGPLIRRLQKKNNETPLGESNKAVVRRTEEIKRKGTVVLLQHMHHWGSTRLLVSQQGSCQLQRTKSLIERGIRLNKQPEIIYEWFDPSGGKTQYR